MPKTLTLRIDNKTYKNFAKRAKAERRTLSNFIENTVKTHLLEQEFMDDSEMAGIMADERLVERMRKGSRNARRRKGHFVG